MQDYNIFIEKIKSVIHLDLSNYKENQMRRRLTTLATKYGATNLMEFYTMITKDAELMQVFLNYLTINVTEFYRNPAQWDNLINSILPKLLTRGNTLRIWSAACSSGEEPYTLVMALSKYIPLSQIEILAVDYDEEILKKARAGVYIAKALESVPPEFKTKYFKEIDGLYHISDDIKSRVKFKRMNLLEDPYPEKQDLIVCRNVMIYFTEDAKHKMYQKFSASLRVGGYLFVGSTEQIIVPLLYNFQTHSTFFYERLEAKTK